MPRAEVFGWSASAISALWFGVHTVVGGPQVADPLIASDLAEVVRVTGWMVWNMITGLLALMAVLYGWATLRKLSDMMLSATALAAVLAGAGIISGFTSGAGLGVIPQGWLFVPVAVLGWFAWQGQRATRTGG